MPEHNPHDRLFRYAFRQPALVRELMAVALPQAILQHLELGRLEAASEVLLDHERGQRSPDLLFSAPWAGDEAHPVLLPVEHQSSVDATMPLRAVEVVIRVWARARQDRPERAGLPVVLPVLVAQDERPWSGPVRLGAMYDVAPAWPEALAARWLDLELIVCDLARLEETEVAAQTSSAVARLVLWSLMSRGSPDEARFEAWRAEFARGRQEGVDTLKAVVRYHWEVSEDEVPMAVRAARASHPAMEVYMSSYAERVMAEAEAKGIEMGIERGIEKGRLEMLLKMLTLRFGPLDEATAARVRSARPDVLDQWAERLLTAATPQDVLRDD